MSAIHGLLATIGVLIIAALVVAGDRKSSVQRINVALYLLWAAVAAELVLLLVMLSSGPGHLLGILVAGVLLLGTPVMLALLVEARAAEQRITDAERLDQWYGPAK